MAIYLLLAVFSVNSVGVVGEVAASWALPTPPAVWVDAAPPTYADPTRSPHAAHRIGTTAFGLEASQVRPLENLVVGDHRIPLAVNRYTGGLPDWPSRLVHTVTGSVRAVTALHVLYGVLLMLFVARILRLGSAPIASGAAILWLSANFDFHFYRKVLGGTEVWLLLGSLLLVRAVWDRRFRGGGMAPWGLGLGLALGLHAKSTFVVLVIATVVTTLLTRFDRGERARPVPIAPRRWLLGGLVALLGLLPALLAGWHQTLVPESPHLFSHDYPDLQTQRLLHGWQSLLEGGLAPAREGAGNWLVYWLGPLAFLEPAYQAEPVSFPSLGRVLSWGFVGLGTVLAWVDVQRDRTARTAMLRWLSIAVPMASFGLFLLNRDVHHQAMLTGWSALWAGLALAQIASRRAPPRSPRRAAWTAVLLLPWLLTGVQECLRFDPLLATSPIHHFREDGQQALEELVRAHQVERLTVCDYDLYGMLDIRLPDVQVDNAWGAMSVGKRDTVLQELLAAAAGGHYLTVRASAPRIYDIDPKDNRLQKAARVAGVVVEPVATLDDADGSWARLFRVSVGARTDP